MNTETDIPIWKRQGFHDTYGMSHVVPFTKKETHKERHHRRRVVNYEYREIVRQWCLYRCVEFKIVGQDFAAWKFKKPFGYAHWIPSKAKLVLCKDYRTHPQRRIKVYDYEQLLLELSKNWL